MSTVFVAGSRQISQLPAEVGSRLDTMIEKGLQILVGDANGADKAVQRYFADRSYPNVLVHCMKDHCRNNVGDWPTRVLIAIVAAVLGSAVFANQRGISLAQSTQSGTEIFSHVLPRSCHY